ncbi:MAG: AbrB/MazE/SpoVT family DNA-binding domain-containing protein [Propionibacteriaceae bacterium]|jgi:AbrB family looped-hinge helix DNA binding protein|nr:AbrB/MazE/SpoVT family DNA-binding domain-containing protein [Propionibacteriaceae bacterium]
MPTATMTSKGQVTVPREVRERLGLTTGSLLDFVPDQGSYRLATRATAVSELFDILPRPSRAATIEEMDAAIAAGAAEAMTR